MKISFTNNSQPPFNNIVNTKSNNEILKNNNCSYDQVEFNKDIIKNTAIPCLIGTTLCAFTSNPFLERIYFTSFGFIVGGLIGLSNLAIKYMKEDSKEK